MKTILLIILSALLLCACGLFEKDKPYMVYWEDNNLCLVLSRPSVGISGPNKVEWNGVDMSELRDDMYESIMKSELTGEFHIWVRFKRVETDKYGNNTIEYDDYKIESISMDEAKKYRHGYYLDKNYQITSKLSEIALASVNVVSFNSDGTVSYKEGIRPDNLENSTINQVESKQKVQEQDSIGYVVKDESDNSLKRSIDRRRHSRF